ncbi:MAG: NAD(P)H-dependent oxidoreductase subunit E [Spirochaetales bacterium]|nr:NAD(P)H-dependent oxidoreductase subunit E [Spirochaetales bacterium]
MKSIVQNVLEKYNSDATRLMDILIDVQEDQGYLPPPVLAEIAETLDISEVDVLQTVSFYHFFSTEPRGKYSVYLNDSVVAEMMGRAKIAEAFEREAGCKFGEVTEDELIGLFDTPCIGMNDQEPAAIINGVIFTELTAFRVKEIVNGMRAGLSVEELRAQSLGDGMNASESLHSTVDNNIHKTGAVIFSDYDPGEALAAISKESLSPEQVIERVKASGVRGRGGAGFPTALKWEFCRKAKGEKHYVFCNADEGEPGTFKDRVILTERPNLVLDGMTVAGYAIGATEGILYLRYEYRYLRDYLEKILADMRAAGQLGKNAGDIKGFDFDIRLQFGAGAYVCGEESALIESAEGKRGEPRDRPPFPVEKGFLGMPTIVNNVETLCQAAKVVVKGADWYRTLGTSQSTGTKVLSVSGDCKFPGVYEIEWGFSVNDILNMVGAETGEVQAVQVGGPSGSCIASNEFSRILSYEDLATGGSLIIIGERHDLLKVVVYNFIDFFAKESCGSCSTCRALTMMYRKTLEKILAGHGKRSDVQAMLDWVPIALASRCGLGHTAPNPIVSTIKNFRHLYEGRIVNADETFESSFDLETSVAEANRTVGRKL